MRRILKMRGLGIIYEKVIGLDWKLMQTFEVPHK